MASESSQFDLASPYETCWTAKSQPVVVDTEDCTLHNHAFVPLELAPSAFPCAQLVSRRVDRAQRHRATTQILHGALHHLLAVPVQSAQLYWEGHFYLGKATELGASSLRLELNCSATSPAKMLQEQDLKRMQQEKELVGLLLSSQNT